MLNEQRENEVKDLKAKRDKVHELLRPVIEPSQNVKPRYPQHETNRVEVVVTVRRGRDQRALRERKRE